MNLAEKLLSARFRVVRPDAPYARCLDDLADCLAEGIGRAGYKPQRSNTFHETAAQHTIDIVVGAHSRACVLPNYPVIIYQTELPSSRWWTPNYVARLNSAMAVWDAVPDLDYELAPNVKRAVLEPGLYDTGADGSYYDPRPVSPGTKDLDLLFYGSLSARRIQVLQRLTDAGLKLEAHFNVYGAERNALIDRAKVVVDVKQAEGDPNDRTRTFFLDSRGACVLTENDSNPARALNPSRIVEQCRMLLREQQARIEHVAGRRSELPTMDCRAAIEALFQTETKPFGNGALDPLTSQLC